MTIYADLEAKIEEIRKLAEKILEDSQNALNEVQTDGNGYISNIGYFTDYIQKIFYNIWRTG